MKDDRAVAGIVAGIIMLGALVAFLAYFNAVWVPTYVANKESSHALDVKAAMEGYADTVEDRVARAIVSRSFSRTVPLGVSGIPVLGTGASGGEGGVGAGPTMNATLGTTVVGSAAGSISLSTHTTQYPNQTYRYALGAMETSQSEGSFVDLRSMLAATRGTGGRLNVTLQVIDITGAPQSAGGSGQATLSGTVNSAASQSYASGAYLRINITGLPNTAPAWRAAMDRTLATNVLTGETVTDCYAASTKNYCYSSGTNTATSVDLLFRSLASGWTVTKGTVAAEVRG